MVEELTDGLAPKWTPDAAFMAAVTASTLPLSAATISTDKRRGPAGDASPADTYSEYQTHQTGRDGNERYFVRTLYIG